MTPEDKKQAALLKLYFEFKKELEYLKNENIKLLHSLKKLKSQEREEKSE